MIDSYISKTLQRNIDYGKAKIICLYLFLSLMFSNFDIFLILAISQTTRIVTKIVIC